MRLVAKAQKVAKARYPRVVASRGEAPKQYPQPEDFDEDEAPTFGINLTTGEVIKLRS